MIIAKIVQKGQIITLEDVVTTFQYSANLKMQFVIDESYKDCIITGWYRKFWKKEEKNLLDMQEDGTFLLGQDVFENDGTVEFSFALNYPDGKIVHLGVVEYYVKKSFGNSDAILPENEDAWITVVSQAVKLQMQKEWDKDYSPQLEENLHVIDNKVDEINLTAADVKQSALESSTNAQSALESANNANDSANLAESAKEKALEFASNAEEFKNSASNLANQANLAKEDARESANNASNSASSALQNANSAKEHLDSAIEKINTFNADYTNKVNSFNSNVENANNTLSVKLEETNTDLDTKITEANSSIDAKVTTATEHANKAKTEADRAVLATDGKLDKNQGVENAGKAMVVGEDGNVVPGSALPDNVYTQEEVDYLLRDKMDKPYTPVTLTENTTIDCTLAGNFKIDSIEGNTVQDVEESIVPTPDRPVPIVSKKVLASGEYVELRSLKESENLFDEKLAIHGYVTSAGEIVSSNKGKRNEKLSDFIPTNNATQLSFYINVTPSGSDNDIDTRLWYGISFYDSNKTFISRVSDFSDYTIENITVTNTINVHASAKYFRFSYRAYEDGKASVVLGAKTINSYIPPTVRDYKIVDHVDKKAWIERNVQEVNINNLVYSYAGDNGEGVGVRFYASVKPTLKFANEIYSNIFISYSAYDYTKESIYGGNSAGGKTLSIIVKESNISEHTQEALLNYINNPNAVAYYALETPVIEEISYLESDTSEFGESFQDSTSPSPTIPAEIEGVTELNIRACGKNLVNIEDIAVGDAQKEYNVNITKPIVISSKKNYTYKESVWRIALKRKSGTNTYYNDINESTKVNATPEDPIIRVITRSVYMLEGICSDIQIEYGTTPTEYEPYKGTTMSYTLKEPLLALTDGSIKDVINLESRVNKLGLYTFTETNNGLFKNDYQDQLGFYGRYFKMNNARGNIAQKVSCNMLPHVNASWNISKESCCQNANQLHLKFSNLRLGIRDDTPIEEKRIAFSNFIKNLYDNGTPLKFLYILENPTTEPLEAELIEKLKQLKTYNPSTNVFVEGEVKPIYNCRYPKDLLLSQQKLESTVLTLQEEVVKNV